jgi:hypothetical protein
VVVVLDDIVSPSWPYDLFGSLIIIVVDIPPTTVIESIIIIIITGSDLPAAIKASKLLLHIYICRRL